MEIDVLQPVFHAVISGYFGDQIEVFVFATGLVMAFDAERVGHHRLVPTCQLASVIAKACTHQAELPHADAPVG
jgi:hypothetical protein